MTRLESILVTLAEGHYSDFRQSVNSYNDSITTFLRDCIDYLATMEKDETARFKQLSKIIYHLPTIDNKKEKECPYH